jgi:hypothetical protein
MGKFSVQVSNLRLYTFRLINTLSSPTIIPKNDTMRFEGPGLIRKNNN